MKISSMALACVAMVAMGQADEQKDPPPPVIYGEEIESENDTIFYVIDMSGSMAFEAAAPDGGPRVTRLELARAEAARRISALPGTARFDVIAYDCRVMPWSGTPVLADS